MSRRSWILFGLLAAFWGASYLFIKVSLEDDLAPQFIVFVRTGLAAVVLLPLARARGALDGIRGQLGAIAILAAIQVAAPFMLITVGEQHLPSALTGILVATAPIFTFLLAFTLEGEERAGALSMAGVVIGLGGVALLLGVDAGGGATALVGGLMVVLASFGYGLGAWFLKRRISGVQPLGVVACTMAATALMVLPFAALVPPTSAPGIDAVGSLAALGVLGTGVAFVIFYTLIGSEGPARASLVAYVAPGFSIVYGVTLLDESFTASTAAGLVLIVGGSWLAAEARLPWPAAQRGLTSELAAGGVDVSPAGEADGRADPALLERGAERGDRVAPGAIEA
jgi:drug/metabolite transporter (DMT)-like permease